MSTVYGRSLVSMVDEISSLAAGDERPDATLSNIVTLVANAFEADVCSVYLLESDRNHLVLAATVGLRQECVGRLRMGMNEGLAGLVAERLQPVAVAQAALHPRFKYFAAAGEDDYQSLLGVPLIDRGVLQGVLTVQTVESRDYLAEEIDALTAVASELAPTVSEALTLGQFFDPSQGRLWSVANNLWWS